MAKKEVNVSSNRVCVSSLCNSRLCNRFVVFLWTWFIRAEMMSWESLNAQWSVSETLFYEHRSLDREGYSRTDDAVMTFACQSDSCLFCRSLTHKSVAATSLLRSAPIVVRPVWTPHSGGKHQSSALLATALFVGVFAFINEHRRHQNS